VGRQSPSVRTTQRPEPMVQLDDVQRGRGEVVTLDGVQELGLSSSSVSCAHLCTS
jgi:hypothetical protein